MAILLQEIISIYPMLSPPTLSPQASNRVCNALALIQCVASHQETKPKLVAAQIPLYLYPFLNTVSKQRPFEYLRLTSLGVIGALVKVCCCHNNSYSLNTVFDSIYHFIRSMTERLLVSCYIQRSSLFA